MYCEFDTLLGPQIAYQFPNEFITKEQMYGISPYIITKPDFQSHLISLKAFTYIFMGFPVVIEDKKYSRNALIFNVVFVFDGNDNVEEYEPVVKKLANYLMVLEKEGSYLSSEETKSNIPDVLRKIYEDLSAKGECTILINHCNTIYLKVVRLPKQPPVVHDHSVPVFLWSKTAIESKLWDLTAHRVLPYIDGFNHVQKIALIADVDLSIVRSAIQTLLFHGVISLIPIFLYSNSYSIKPEIVNISKNKEMQLECVSYVAKDPMNKPNFRDVFMLYCALGPGISVQALCSRHDPSSLGIDEQKLIQYGLIKNLIHKLNKYPILLSPEQSLVGDRSKWMNGYYNYEEISCKSVAAGDPFQHEEINQATENDPSVLHILK